MPIPPPPGPFSYEKIDGLLLAVARELPRQPDWYLRLARLNRSATPENRLPIYKAVRDDGCLPEDAGFFLLSYTIEDLSYDGQRILYLINEDIMKGSSSEGDKCLDSDDGFAEDDLGDDEFDEDYFDEDDEFDDDDDELDQEGFGQSSLESEGATEEYQELLLRPGESPEEWYVRSREASVKRHILRNLSEYGECEMADLLKRHHDEFRHRHEKGRRFFFEPPEAGAAELRAAVQELYDHVRQCVGSRSPIGPLACRWSIDYGFVDLQVYPTPTELVGGPNDGAVVDPDIDFDLLRIQEAFDTIDGIGWTLDGEDRESQYVCVRGTFRRHDVWLTIFAGAPNGQKPTMKSDELHKWRAYRGDAP